MRVTNSMMTTSMMNNMSKNLQGMSKYQEQMASGKKINKASDDPIIASRALKLRTSVSEISQFKRNAQDATNWMDITESAMNNTNDVLQRARELTVQGANGTLTPDDRDKAVAELAQLKETLIQQMNATYSGRYVFSGKDTDKPLLNSDGTYNVVPTTGDVTAYEVSKGDYLRVNTLGPDVLEFDANPPVVGGTPDVIKMMDDTIANLKSGDSAAISSSLGQMDLAIGKGLEARADLGARYNRLEMVTNRLEDDELNFTSLMSNNEDADMAEVLMNLKTSESVYRASMAAGARVIQPSLMDFLR